MNPLYVDVVGRTHNPEITKTAYVITVLRSTVYVIIDNVWNEIHINNNDKTTNSSRPYKLKRMHM